MVNRGGKDRIETLQAQTEKKRITISGREGDDAKPYQEKELRKKLSE
jgi:hypothetical protein